MGAASRIVRQRVGELDGVSGGIRHAEIPVAPRLALNVL